MSNLKTILSALLFLTASTWALADLDTELGALQTRWAEVNYQLEGKAKVKAFEQLVSEADRLAASYPERAEGWIWSGIVKSTLAGARGGLGALKYAKAAKSDLEKALNIDAQALQGSAYASLGTLYYKVPGWPLGFGDDKKAEELLKEALAVNPEGIDSNYFYGDFLLSEKRYNEARDYLLRAQRARPRPNRELADAGRQQEITQALKTLGEAR